MIVHHLKHSQSERIVWLCEELGLPYERRVYERRADNRMAPPEYKGLHPLGAAPVITDGDVVLAESGAIVEYILARYGRGRLAVAADQPRFADYVYWLHVANGSLQPALLRLWYIERVDPAAAGPARERFELLLAHLDARLADQPYLAGAEFTAADIMNSFTLTTMRRFRPFELPGHVARYVERITSREAYRRV